LNDLQCHLLFQTGNIAYVIVLFQMILNNWSCHRYSGDPKSKSLPGYQWNVL